MINIEEIQSQVVALKSCVDNYNLSVNLLMGLQLRSTQLEIEGATAIVSRCEQTLIGQLKLMNIQNEKLLKL